MEDEKRALELWRISEMIKCGYKIEDVGILFDDRSGGEEVRPMNFGSADFHFFAQWQKDDNPYLRKLGVRVASKILLVPSHAAALIECYDKGNPDVSELERVVISDEDRGTASKIILHKNHAKLFRKWDGRGTYDECLGVSGMLLALCFIVNFIECLRCDHSGVLEQAGVSGPKVVFDAVDVRAMNC